MSDWILAIGYAILATAPLLVARVVAPGYGSFATELGLAFGFLAFSTAVLQFTLVSRIRTSRVIGADRLVALHRGMGLVIIGVALLHVGLSAAMPRGEELPDWSELPVSRSGTLALSALMLLTVTSIWRRRLRLSYEAWQTIHVASALTFTVTAACHSIAIRRYTASSAVAGTIGMYVLVLAGVVLRNRLVRPWRLGTHPWEIVENDDVGGDARRLRVRPLGHRGFDFEAGQFAWLVTGRSPFWAEQHPLSIAAAPAATGEVEFLVKALGDWSGGTVPHLRPGSIVWVDGPYGAFVPRAADDEPLVLIAGGIGIAPMLAILRQLAGRGSRRSTTLILGASAAERIVASSTLSELVQRLGATFVPVFEHPRPDWSGERGFITAELIRRHAPAPLPRCEFLLCGPLAMIDAVTSALTSLGVPEARVITERFEVV